MVMSFWLTFFWPTLYNPRLNPHKSAAIDVRRTGLPSHTSTASFRIAISEL